MRIRQGVEVVLLIEVVLFQKWQYVDAPSVRDARGPHACLGLFVIPGAGELAERVMVAVLGQRDLLEIVAALHPVGRLADLLDCGE